MINFKKKKFIPSFEQNRDKVVAATSTNTTKKEKQAFDAKHLEPFPFWKEKSSFIQMCIQQEKHFHFTFFISKTNIEGITMAEWKRLYGKICVKSIRAKTLHRLFVR